MPATRMAADARRRTRRVRRWDWRRSGAGGHDSPFGYEATTDRMHGAHHVPDRYQPLEQAVGGNVALGVQQPHVEIGTRLELHPAQTLTVDEDGRQSQAPRLLLDHFGGGPHVGVEADTEVGQFRLEGGSSDQSGVSSSHQEAAGIARRVVGRAFDAHRVEGASTQHRPDAAAQQAEGQGQHGKDDDGEQGGHRQPATPPCRVDMPERPSGDPGPRMSEDGRGKGNFNSDGHGEGDQEPPGVATQPAVEQPGGDEPGEGGRIAQAVQSFEPRGVARRSLGQRPPALAGQGALDRRRAWRQRPDRTPTQ